MARVEKLKPNADGIFPLRDEWSEAESLQYPTRRFKILQRTADCVLLQVKNITGEKTWYEVTDIIIDPSTSEERVRFSTNIDGSDKDDIHFSYDRMFSAYQKFADDIKLARLRRRKFQEANEQHLKELQNWETKVFALKRMKGSLISELKALVFDNTADVLVKDKTVRQISQDLNIFEILLKWGNYERH